MVVIAERSIQTILLNAIALFRANLDVFVPDIYAQETTEHQQEITSWWSNSANQNPPVLIGYTLQPTQNFEFAITTMQSSEVSGMRVIGNAATESSTGLSYATQFQSTYTVTCFSSNQNWLLWGQALAKWGLLMNRLVLEQDYDLYDQVISLGPLAPTPDSYKDSTFPYMRQVHLTCKHADTWTPLPAQSITDVNVTVTPTYTELGG